MTRNVFSAIKIESRGFPGQYKKNVLPLPSKLYIKYLHSALSGPKQISFHFHFQLNRTFATLVLPAQINFLKIILLLIALPVFWADRWAPRGASCQSPAEPSFYTPHTDLKGLSHEIEMGDRLHGSIENIVNVQHAGETL